MALITLISIRELIMIFIITRTLNMNFVVIAGIKEEPFIHVPYINNDNSQINRGSTSGSMR